MNRLRYRSWLLGVAVLSLLAAKPMTAISPTAIMVYGEGLKTPILLQPTGPTEFGAFGLLWWRAGRFDVPHSLQSNPLLTTLSKRTYLKLAIFWGLYYPDQLTPENAS